MQVALQAAGTFCFVNDWASVAPARVFCYKKASFVSGAFGVVDEFEWFYIAQIGFQSIAPLKSKPIL